MQYSRDKIGFSCYNNAAHYKNTFFTFSGGPVVPSGNLSSPSVSSASSQPHMVPTIVGYTTTGRPSSHQSQPMSFTRALEITENLDQGGGGQQQQQQPRVRVQQQPQQEPQSAGEDGRRDSVYDMSSYEISV